MSVLIPNGRNEDGTLKSNAVSFSRVLTFTNSLTGNHYFVIESENNMYFVGEDAYYDESINKINDYGIIKNLIIVASLTATSGVISNWNPKTVFHAVDYSDLGKKLDADKIQQVSTLPVSPVAGTLYLIPE